MPRKFGLKFTGDGRRATGGEKRVKVDWCSSGFTPRLVKTKVLGARY